MKRLIGLLLLAASTTLLADTGSDAPVIKNAWVREAPPGARMLAGYLVIENPSDRERVLVGVESPAFAHIMLHRSVTVEGVARMQHVDSLTIPAHGRVALEPGAYHLMMPAPATRLVSGDKVELSLEFADGQRRQVTADVRKKP